MSKQRMTKQDHEYLALSMDAVCEEMARHVKSLADRWASENRDMDVIFSLLDTLVEQFATVRGIHEAEDKLRSGMEESNVNADEV